jgi:hypothetical protein
MAAKGWLQGRAAILCFCAVDSFFFFFLVRDEFVEVGVFEWQVTAQAWPVAAMSQYSVSA